MKTIYLCGPINGCTDGEATDWRERVKSQLAGKFNFLDPMRRDYRGRELEPGIAEEIVAGDKEDLRASDILLAYCPRPSVGTSMEIVIFQRLVVVVHPGPRPSPWLVVHCDEIFSDFDGAIAFLEVL